MAAALASVAVIMTADNFFVLLFGWETLTVAFYLLAGYDRDRPGRAEGSVVTAIFGRASGAALLIGALLLAGRTHTFAFIADGIDPHSAAGQAAYALLLFGFGIKVGLVPAHIWMPRGTLARPGRLAPSWPVSPSTSASTACGAPCTCSARRPCG